MAQRSEECSNGERRSNNDHWRLRGLPGKQAHKRLETDYQANVDQHQRDRQNPVDQRAIDDDIDIPQAGAQHGEANRERQEEGKDGKSRTEERVERAIVLGGQVASKADRYQACNQDRKEAEGHPLGLLALHRIGHPEVAVELRQRQDGPAAEPGGCVDRSVVQRPAGHAQGTQEQEIAQDIRGIDQRDPEAPARHEPPVGEEGDSGENGQAYDQVQPMLRNPPEGGAVEQGVCEVIRAHTDEHQRDQQDHPVIRFAPEKDAAHCKPDECRDPGEDDPGPGIGVERNASLQERLHLARRQSASRIGTPRAGAGLMQGHKSLRQTGDKIGQDADNQRNPDHPCQDEPTS